MKLKWGIITVLLLILMGSWGFYQNQSVSGDEVLRLHIIAHSDALADQALKLQVRDELLELMRSDFEPLHSAREAEAVAAQELEIIRAAAQQVVWAKGFDYPVAVYLGEYDFPAKAYGDLVLPQGRYHALRVVIGAGEGKNWWCVLFPPLCMVADTEKGLSLSAPEQVQVSWKLLEVIPEGLKEKFWVQP